jgi:ketosteroid isomerase-like protein
MSSDELMGSGIVSLIGGSYAIVLTPRSGASAIQDGGTCLWIWERDADGAWKLARAIWNSANPIPAAV